MVVAVVMLCVVVPWAARSQDVDGRGTASTKLEGSVLDFVTGEPIMLATVEAATDDFTSSTSTGFDGTFAFEGLPRTLITLHSSRLGYGSSSDSVDLTTRVDPVQIELTKSDGNQLYYERLATTIHARAAEGTLTYEEAFEALPVGDFSKNARQLLAASLVDEAPADSKGQLANLLRTYDFVIEPSPVADSNVRFALGEVGLTEEGKRALDTFAAPLASANANVYLEIIGYPDAGSDPATGQTLAARRAEEVASYLSSRHGFSPNHLIEVPIGENPPGNSKLLAGYVTIVVLR
jgi:outer membrane protein OmpA-like peptidoglycan-associated protein